MIHMDRKYHTPIRKIKEDYIFGDRYEHESWAKIQMSKVSGSRHLFGSEVKHNFYFRMKITSSDMTISSGEKRYFEGKKYLELDLSASQLLEMITNINNTEGVCATLVSQDNKIIPQAEHGIPTAMAVAKEGFVKGVQKKAELLSSTIERLTELFESKNPLKKDEKRNVLFLLENLRTSLSGDADFFIEQFNDAAEITVQQAKSEIESFINTALIAKGVEALNVKPVEMLED
jgi:hypothetical protein